MANFVGLSGTSNFSSIDDYSTFSKSSWENASPPLPPCPPGVPHPKMHGTLELWMWCWDWMWRYYPGFFNQHVVRRAGNFVLLLPWLVMCVSPEEEKWKAWKNREYGLAFFIKDLGLNHQLMSLAGGNLYYARIAWNCNKENLKVFSMSYAKYNPQEWQRNLISLYNYLKEQDL